MRTLTRQERKALITLSKQRSGDPHLDRMVKETIEERLLQDARLAQKVTR